MIYYSSNYEILDTDKYVYFNSGANSRVFKKDDELLKLYFFDINKRYHMKKSTFKMLKKANIPNLVKLRDYYYRFTGWTEIIMPIDGYTMDYVSGKTVELISANKDYIDMILRQLEETLEKLSDKKILIIDSHKDNVILDENGVTLLDLDYYYKSRISSSNYVYQENKKQLIHSINSICSYEFKKHNNNKVMRSLIYPSDSGSLTNDFKKFYNDDNIEQTIKKRILSP